MGGFIIINNLLLQPSSFHVLFPYHSPLSIDRHLEKKPKTQHSQYCTEWMNQAHSFCPVHLISSLKHTCLKWFCNCYFGMENTNIWGKNHDSSLHPMLAQCMLAHVEWLWFFLSETQAAELYVPIAVYIQKFNFRILWATFLCWID